MLLVLIVLIVLVLVVRTQLFRAGIATLFAPDAAEVIDRTLYQAVFLTNGQTYFGRYYDRIGAYAKIEDVYYLQQVASSDPNAAPDTRILRRGRELHEPAPRMLIPKSAILFVEDLTDASPIAQFMQRDAGR